MRTGRPRQFDVDAAVDAAVRVFWDKGYAGTSLLDLRTAMGISSASFYGVFGSKAALFHRVVQRYTSGPGSVTDIVVDPDITPRAAVEHALRESIRMQTDPEHAAGCLVALTTPLTAADGADEPAANRRAVDRRRFTERLSHTTDATPAGLATLVHTFLLGVSTQARDGIPADELDRAVDCLMELWPPTPP